MAAPFDVQLVTPQGVLFSGPSTMLTVPGVAGTLGILANHAPLLTELRIGEAALMEPDGYRRHFYIGGGFIEVNQNKVTILAEEATGEDEMDPVEAQRLHQEAIHHLELSQGNEDEAEAAIMLERAAARLRVLSRNRPDRR